MKARSLDIRLNKFPLRRRSRGAFFAMLSSGTRLRHFQIFHISFSDIFNMFLSPFLSLSGIHTRCDFFEHQMFNKMEFYMKALNTFFSVVFASVLVFSLAGCGDKEESKTFKADVNGTEIVMTYTYKGDKVINRPHRTKLTLPQSG